MKNLIKKLLTPIIIEIIIEEAKKRNLLVDDKRGIKVFIN